MIPGDPFVLTLNAGSSSLKFALFRSHEEPELVASGAIERVGQPQTSLKFKPAGGASQPRPVSAQNPQECLELIFGQVRSYTGTTGIAAIGHRIVHGGARFTDPQPATPELLDELRRISPYDPEHLPAEIALLEASHQQFPGIPQIVCFDTAFHHDLPRVAQLLPIPRRYEKAGVRRYGFHGLSYEFLLGELVRLNDPAATRGRVILAHLGSGASLAAVRDGHSIDTSMAFTPTAGLVMSTRTGDLDPGLVAYLARTEKMDAVQFQHLVNHQSGLLGLSETTSDMRDLIEREATDIRAAEAIAVFCYQVKKWIGSFAAALGGLDTLVFAGGIGENCPSIRARICDGLGFLGIELDETLNAVSAKRISVAAARVAVRVISTNEELVIARAANRFLPAEAARK